jgi:hypothetical protein
VRTRPVRIETIQNKVELKMKKTLFATASLAATAMMLPVTAHALDYLFAGATVTSEYTSQGGKLSDGLSFPPYVEAGIGNFYFGAYAATADDGFAGYSVEYGPYFGYRSSIGKLSYDAALYFYQFDNDVESYEELTLSLGYAVTDAFSIGAYVGYADDIEDGFGTDQTELSLNASYATGFNDITIVASYGNVDFSTPGFGSVDWDFWSVGFEMPLGDSAGLEVLYHGSDAVSGVDVADSADGLITVAVSFDFSLR